MEQSLHTVTLLQEVVASVQVPASLFVQLPGARPGPQLMVSMFTNGRLFPETNASASWGVTSCVVGCRLGECCSLIFCAKALGEWINAVFLSPSWRLWWHFLMPTAVNILYQKSAVYSYFKHQLDFKGCLTNFFKRTKCENFLSVLLENM